MARRCTHRPRLEPRQIPPGGHGRGDSTLASSVVFIDTSAFVGRANPDDQFHFEADRLGGKLVPPVRPVTATPVLYETAELLRRRMSAAFAQEFHNILRSHRDLEIFTPEPEDENDAFELMRKYADNRIGFVDCLTAALMNRRGITTIFTFDRHFERLGFTLFS